jgi:hypothetical protein
MKLYLKLKLSKKTILLPEELLLKKKNLPMVLTKTLNLILKMVLGKEMSFI